MTAYLPIPHKSLLLGVLALLGLSSCSLPSEEAWRQIRQEGLLTYLSKETPDHKPATQPVKPISTSTQSLVATVPASKPPVSTAVATASMPTAQAVPGLDGYVRTPFTNPPRLVDVRGMTAGSKVVCPYTHRAFLVPKISAERQSVAASAPASAEPSPAPQPKPEPSASPKPAAETPTTAAVITAPPQEPTQVAANTTPAPQPPPAPQAQLNPTTAQQMPPEAPKQPEPQVQNELPMGVAIPGRPGFVNSPFAAKHQLVDVTGLPTGMEVKCPYTGKLFRVPPQASTPPQQ